MRAAVRTWLASTGPTSRRDRSGRHRSRTLARAAVLLVCGHRSRARAGDSRGGSSAISTVLLVGVMGLAIIGTFQATVWWHGRGAALHAAAAAAEAERVLTPSSGAGQQAAAAVASQTGLVDPQVSVSRSATEVTVTVTARVPLFIDIGLGRFTEHVTMPRERITQR